MIDILLISFIVLIISAISIGIMEWKIKKISTIYNEIRSINKQTNFHPVDAIISIDAELKSKKEFDTTNFDTLFSRILLDYSYSQKIDNIISYAKYNHQQWEFYQEKLSQLSKSNTKIDSKKTLIPQPIYIKLESNLINKTVYSKPTTAPVFEIIKSYTSPAGRNSYRSTKNFTIREVYSYRDHLKEKEKREKAYRQTASYQRSLMTDSLRYDILKRDGFKCQLCGYSQEDGVKLHVDHIVPVARGGKTVKNNLRALCAACNSGKSDKYDYQGVN